MPVPEIPQPPAHENSRGPDLSVVIAALHEAENLRIILPDLHARLAKLKIRFEILVVTEPADRETQAAAAALGARAVVQQTRGYGGALRTGFAAAQGDFIATMDADYSHRPAFIEDLWAYRGAAEVIIASRYTPGGQAHMPARRYWLSRILNAFFSRGLDLAIRDMSSGFRLYKAGVVKRLTLTSCDFDILQEILVQAYVEGWRVLEIPFTYEPRRYGSSHARIFRFGLAYLRTFRALRRVRNSILAGDYDSRAYDSIILPQRYWQRRRLLHISELTAAQGRVLDVGCGSSRIIGALRPDSVALDLLQRKLRYARRFGRPLVRGSGCRLPFGDGAFECVLCSQVIEHLSKDVPILDELERVLAPGGRLVLGTPDYSRWQWRAVEMIYGWVIPGGYADEHIGPYTRDELIERFAQRGFTLEATRYILQGELILALRKGAEKE